jgi:hypothetical protein
MFLPRLLGDVQQRCVSGLVGARPTHQVSDAPVVRARRGPRLLDIGEAGGGPELN